MKKKKYLPLYYKWMGVGEIPVGGLCNVFGNPLGPGIPNVSDYYKEFELMIPPHSGQYVNAGYWGTQSNNRFIRNKVFCPLRQNIVLFLAALNNEL